VSDFKTVIAVVNNYASKEVKNSKNNQTLKIVPKSCNNGSTEWAHGTALLL
jgi:hypothetical protein